MIRQTLRRAAMALTIAAFAFSQVTWALAGTTGGIGGVVTDGSGAPVSGASVKVLSASQSAATSTDATGHFNFLSLAPDSYTVAIEKTGYESQSYAGVTVFADNQLALTFKLSKTQLITIGKTTARAAGDLVKGGVGSDVYNVNSAAIASTAVLGGGGNLNSAYSAMSSVPGVVVPQGGAGWNQPTFVRGSQAFFTGFEYDGIPVNRAFDNYNSSTESNLGLQELQVYTGGGPASNSSSGTSGFVNQVFKTGTYPGYATLGASLGGPTFYHQAKVEAGGASPDRRFSYYLGLSGYDQQFRFIDNANGGALANSPTSPYTGEGSVNTALFPSAYGTCNTSVEPGSAGWDPNPLWSAAGSNWYKTAAPNGNCVVPFPGNYGTPVGISDRENIANFHFKIPRKNGMSDDVQLLGSASAFVTSFYSSPNDAGGLAAYQLAVTGNAYCAPGSNVDVYGNVCASGDPANGNIAVPGASYPAYVDAHVYNLPFGSPVSGIAASNYFQPSSNPNRAFGAQLPANLRDVQQNDTGIIKLQYTHQLSDKAFVRAFGYTFFSDWTQAGANASYNNYEYGIGGPVDPTVAANYDLITHTAGGELQFVDQIATAHLVELTANYTSASVVRFNNTGFTTGASSVGLISNSGGNYTCYSKTTGAALASCGLSGYTAAANTTGTYNPVIGTAAANGAQWVTLWNGDAKGSYNTVKPRFAFVSLSDQWRPTDKLLINGALRYDDFVYGLQANGGPASAFYAQIIQTSVCQNASGVVYTKPLLPGQAPPAPVIYTTTCPAGYTHPAFTSNSPSQYTIADLSPRLSATYTQSPETVWRASIGRFTEPPISASVQYLNTAGDNRSVWNATLPLGFNTPFHPIPAQSATQADLSLERHIHGTDMSFKISPFYNFTTGYQEQSFIGPNFVTQTPVGNFKSTGVEVAFTKGDFAKDGLSGQVSVAYTKAQVQATNWFGNNQYVAVNQAIGEFNKLTKGGGGSPFYCSGGADASGNPSPGVTSAAACATLPTAGTPITNPYYNTPTQNLLTINAWNPPALTGISPTNNPGQAFYDTPWNATLILNYRKNKLAITPSFQLSEGTSYGSPLDVIGIDPRTCASNATTSGIVALSPSTDPNACDYSTASGTLSTAAGHLFIPNPETGSFATPGQFRNPWQLGANLAVSYEISPKVQANLTVANAWHTCFGGTKTPWTAAYPVDKNNCLGYVPSPLYVSNFYNGTSSSDLAANGLAPQPWQQHSYIPATGGVSIPMNVYFSLNVKL